jgi:hypothetical protein
MTRDQNAHTDPLEVAQMLRLAAARGVTVKLRLGNGWHYRADPPIIIGRDYVQFATPTTRAPMHVRFADIVSVEIL